MSASLTMLRVIAFVVAAFSVVSVSVLSEAAVVQRPKPPCRHLAISGYSSGHATATGRVLTSCPADRQPSCPVQGKPPRYRTADGSCHSAQDPTLGMSGTPYKRVLAADYADGVHAPRSGSSKGGLPSARLVVNALLTDLDRPNPVTTHFFMNWLQMLAHDTVRSNAPLPDPDRPACCAAAANGPTDACTRIDVPGDDPFYARYNVTCLGMDRASAQPCATRAHDQRNMVTHFVDASLVYGSDADTAQSLRQGRGGLLRVRVIDGGEQLPEDDSGTLLLGDNRATLSALLFATQTVLVREHNRLARGLAKLNRHWNDERLYQEARKINVGQWQFVSYRDVLPLVVGAEAADQTNLRPAQDGYAEVPSNDTLAADPRTANEYAAAACRSLHSLVQSRIQFGRDSSQSGTITDTPPNIVEQRGMLQSVVEGMLYQPTQRQDQFMAFEIKNRVFANGRPYGGDVISADIQRGREFGVPSYNAFRASCGLARAARWADFGDLISRKNIDTLKTLYNRPDDVDFVVGGLLETLGDDTSASASITSPVFRCVVVEQYLRHKKGDPYFVDRDDPQTGFTKPQLREIRKRTASKLLCDNIQGLEVVPSNAFLQLGIEGNHDVNCSELPDMDLKPWKDGVHFL